MAPQPGGLVTALEPILRHANGAWVGWPGTPDVDLDPFIEDGLKLHPVGLTETEVAEYYEGFSNTSLWPLYHDAVVTPTFDRRWWRTYVQVNEKFAQAAARAAAPGATVWVHDYQLQLVPRMLREARPDLTIGFFLHIPFPPPRNCSSSCRGARRSSRVCSEPIWSDFTFPAAPRTSGS